MITEKELILKIKTLKQVKPSEKWAFLLKSSILGSNVVSNKNIVANKAIGLSGIFSFFLQKKLAYALAVFLFLVAGVFGFMNYILPNDSTPEISLVEKSPAALMAIKSDVEDFKVKSRNLSEVARANSSEVSLVVEEVKVAVKELTDAIKKDPQLAKVVALDINNNKTYLDIPGGNDDLKEISDVLYRTIDEQMMKDLAETSLTESQQEAFDIIKDLYRQGKYSSALENILLLNIAIENN